MVYKCLSLLRGRLVAHVHSVFRNVGATFSATGTVHVRACSLHNYSSSSMHAPTRTELTDCDLQPHMFGAPFFSVGRRVGNSLIRRRCYSNNFQMAAVSPTGGMGKTPRYSYTTPLSNSIFHVCLEKAWHMGELRPSSHGEGIHTLARLSSHKLCRQWS